jgi:hypothetical protein
MRGDVVKKRRRPPRASNSQGSSSAKNTPREASGSGQHGEEAGTTPMNAGIAQSDVPDFIRKMGDLVWYEAEGGNGPGEAVAADADGIAIMRYEFKHVASTSP